MATEWKIGLQWTTYLTLCNPIMVDETSQRKVSCLVMAYTKSHRAKTSFHVSARSVWMLALHILRSGCVVFKQ